MLQQILDKFSLSFDDLNAAEKDTLRQWADSLSRREVTAETLKAHVAALISALEREITGLEEPKGLFSWLFQRKRDLHLKARLRNYLMIQDFLTGPDKARKWIEAQLSNIKR